MSRFSRRSRPGGAEPPPGRDAFGNALRPSDATAAFGAPDPAPTVAPAPADTPAPVNPPTAVNAPAPAPDAPPPTPVRRAAKGRSPSPIRTVRRATGGCLAFVVAVLTIGGCFVALVADKAGTGVDAVRSLSTQFDTTLTAPTVPGATTGAAATPPTGLGRGSLLRPEAFGDAVARLRRAGLGRLRFLRVSPARIDAQLVTPAGRLRSVELLPGGAPKTLSTSTAGASTVRTISLAAIDRGAPQRLARSAAGRARTSTGSVEYAVLVDVGGEPGWVLYLRSGRGFRADRTGRSVRAIG